MYNLIMRKRCVLCAQLLCNRGTNSSGLIDMTFLQLEYFHAVAESGSITRVAEQYNISPAALSRSISQLERELRAELFDHEGRTIVLNENGKIFLQCTAEILESMLTARKRLSDATQRRLVRVRFDVMLDEPGELPIEFKRSQPD